MNRRLLQIPAVIILAGVGIWYGISSTSELSPAYMARTEKHAAQGIDGAMAYYKTLRANIYTGEVEREDVYGMREAMRKIVQKNSKNNDVNWVSMGPDNVGGRVRAILPFPNDPNTIIAGGVSGGLFKTTNAGQQWQRINSFSENLAVSSIAMLGNGAIYVGTGNSREIIAGNGSSGFIGGGLFVSLDQGATWSLVSNFKPQIWNPNSNWSTIDCMVADPSNPERLWLGADFGLYPYIHGSNTLPPLPSGLTSGVTKDVAVSADGQHVLTMIGTRLFVSTDFGQTFTQMGSANNFPTTGNGATELAISPNDKNFMVVSVAQPNGFLRGIWATVNAGQTWNIIAPNSNNGQSQFTPFFNGLTAQGWYDNMITIVPDLPDGIKQVIMGGIRMWRWTLTTPVPGITAWEEVNANFASFPGGPPNPFYVHSDIHTAAWDSQNNLYIGSDGGINRSDNNGFTWVDRNRDFTTTQYYAIAFDPQGRILGGLQDNGTLLITLLGATPKQAIQFTGGDGFDCEISQMYPNFMFSTIYNGAVFRSFNNGQTVTTMGNLTALSQGGGTDFFTNIALHEHPNNENSEIKVIYTPAGDDPNIVFFPPGQFEVTANNDTIIGRVPAGTFIIIDNFNSPGQVSGVVPEDLNFYSYYQRQTDIGLEILSMVGDTARFKETQQFMMAAALSNGVYVTRQPLKTNGPPTWYRLSTGESAQPSKCRFSPDGNILYVGYTDGRLFRYANFNNSWTGLQLTQAANNPEFNIVKTLIHNGPGSITDIEVDYSQGMGEGGIPASERVVLTHGGYGGSAKVRVSDVAASALGTGTFNSIWNVPSEIAGMPVYSVVMDINNNQVFMVGTEYGVWYTDNNGQSWTEANNGDMNRVPVFDLRQQKRPAWVVPNNGVVYAGTHGRGIFKTDYLLSPPTSVTDHTAFTIPALGGLKLFPNPVQSETTVQFDLGASADVSIRIFNISGQLVKTISNRRIESGKERVIRFDASELPAGPYVLQLSTDNARQTVKFIKTGR